MTLKVVHDTTLDRALGSSQLADDLRGSMHPGGDCRSCGRPIQDGQSVRIDAQRHPSEVLLAWARHAGCRPSTPEPGEDSSALFVTPHNYRTFVYATQMNSNAGSSFGAASVPVLLPIMILNPGIDGATVPLGQDGVVPDQLISPYLERGFTRPDASQVGNAGIARELGMFVHIAGAEVTLHDPWMNTYTAPLRPQLAKAIEDRGGLMLTVTYRYFVDDVAAQAHIDPRILTTVGTDVEHVALAWVPLRR